MEHKTPNSSLVDLRNHISFIFSGEKALKITNIPPWNPRLPPKIPQYTFSAGMHRTLREVNGQRPENKYQVSESCTALTSWHWVNPSMHVRSENRHKLGLALSL